MLYSLLLDRTVLLVHGEDMRLFLQGIISNDIAKATPDHSIYALLLTPQGKYWCDLFITEENGRLLLDYPTARKEELIRRLSMYKLRSKVTIEDASGEYAVVSFHGEALSQEEGRRLSSLPGASYADPRLASLGARGIIPKENAEETLQQAGIQKSAKAYDLYRIRAGVPEGEKDMQLDKAFPLEYGMDRLHAIDFAKGCYVGQEVTARTKYRGVVRKAIYYVQAEAPLPEYGSEVIAGENKIGRLCSHIGNEGLALLRIEEYREAIQAGEKLFVGDQELKVIEM